MKDTTLRSTPPNPTDPTPTPTPTHHAPSHLAVAHRLAWAVGTASVLYFAITLGTGTGTATRNPLAIGGLLLLGIGLTRQARLHLHR